MSASYTRDGTVHESRTHSKRKQIYNMANIFICLKTTILSQNWSWHYLNLARPSQLHFHYHTQERSLFFAEHKNMPTVILLDVSLSMSRPVGGEKAEEKQRRQLAINGIKTLLNHCSSQAKMEFVSLVSNWPNLVFEYASLQLCCTKRSCPLLAGCVFCFTWMLGSFHEGLRSHKNCSE